jgi:hypothetical protein
MFARKIMLVFLLMMTISMLMSCGDVQQAYYEVHVITVDHQPFYYIDPSEGKDTWSVNKLGTGMSIFIYLYEPTDGVEFNYEQFFSTIQTHFVEEHVQNGKLYVVATPEIDNQVNQYFLDKYAWQQGQ